MKKMYKNHREDNNTKNNYHLGKGKEILVEKNRMSNNIEGKRRVRSKVMEELMLVNY